MTVAGTINDLDTHKPNYINWEEGVSGGPGCLCLLGVDYLYGVEGISNLFFLLFGHLQHDETLMRYQGVYRTAGNCTRNVICRFFHFAFIFLFEIFKLSRKFTVNEIPFRKR